MIPDRRTSRPLRSRGITVIAVALTALLLPATPAEAGTLDLGLLAQSEKVLQFASKKGWKNVGVLPFQVKRGSRPHSYTAAPLCHDITCRLENALILATHADAPEVGIIRDAVRTANEKGVGSYRSDPKAFALLFAEKMKFRLAWANEGDSLVRADAFLTGKVENTGQRRETTVKIYGFDRTCFKNGGIAFQKVCEFTVPTDRMLAADLGYNFVLKRALVASRDVKSRQRDEGILEEIRSEDEKQPLANQPNRQQPGQQHEPENIAGFRFELIYDGASQPLTPFFGKQQGSLAAEYQAPTAPPAARIHMALTRLSAEQGKLGVVLKVNGQSTWQMEDLEPIECRKWIYDLSKKDQRDLFEGFYVDVTGDNLHRFRSLTAEESAVRAAELGSRAGWIDVYVFASGAQNSGDEGQMLISTRGTRQGQRLGLKALQASLWKTNHLSEKMLRKLRASANQFVQGKGLIDYEPYRVPGDELRQDNLPNPVLVGHLAIRYYDDSKVIQPPQPVQPNPAPRPDQP